jgi:hypothetical protein
MTSPSRSTTSSASASVARRTTCTSHSRCSTQ